ASIHNRLGTEGEELVVHRFYSGTLGLASPADVQRCADKPRGVFEWLWGDQIQPAAVCVPPGARLFLQNIPVYLQALLAVGAAEEVTFVQLSAEAYRYRDAVRFGNGREVLLQRLQQGQHVHVLSLDAAAIEPRRLSEHEREALV